MEQAAAAPMTAGGGDAIGGGSVPATPSEPPFSPFSPNPYLARVDFGEAPPSSSPQSGWGGSVGSYKSAYNGAYLS